MSPRVPSASCGVGFICHTRGAASHTIVARGIEAVVNLTHRGAVGADGKTGDGAGILFQLPKKFFHKELKKLGATMRNPGSLAVGVFFLSAHIEPDIEAIAKRHGFAPLAWRDVPVNEEALGASALAAKPRIRHLLIDASATEEDLREVNLYLLRRDIDKTLTGNVYIPSLSSRIIVYKGMLVAPHLTEFYPDLNDHDIESAFCMFHQRFSTNTSPDWTLAQPFRSLAHNGEINTLQGNRNWMAVLEHEITHQVFGDRTDLIRPLVSPEESDSASLDRIVELLVLAGLSPEHAVIMCIPPAWENEDLGKDERAFFEYHSLLMKPWDGPAAVTFTNGETIGAHMDRNGLRPLRYTLTEDGILVLGSETGMVDLGARAIREKGRLGPGETISVNMLTGKVRFDAEIIHDLSRRHPYAEWMERHHRRVKSGGTLVQEKDDVIRRQIAFDYTSEEIRSSIRDMAATGKELVFSMGDDTPLPPLSARPQLLFRYFKQRFSQVTNPAIDPIRERMVMSLTMNMGVKRNFLVQEPEHARRFGLESPVLLDGQMREIESQNTWPVKRISITYTKSGTSLAQAVEKLQKQVIAAIQDDNVIIILSDKDIKKEKLAIPSLLALSASYKALMGHDLANRASLIAETGEARDTHHFACLVGYGASAVYPYLACQTIRELCDTGTVHIPYEQAVQHYKKAVEDGLLKVIARLGISTINSYHAAQLFDALCLDRGFIGEYFTGTPCTLESDGIPEIEASLMKRHAAAYEPGNPVLDSGGEMKYKKDGEHHAWSARTVGALNRFMKSGEYDAYREYARTASDHPVFLRHLMGYKKGIPVPLDRVEPEEAILKRFVAGAMSVGALSPEAHETIAEACNRLGIKSNSGEGGEDPARYFGPKNSAMKQIASGRFGVTPTYLASAADLEIKIAQGAKPGEGGHLPKEKVTDYIARLRHCNSKMLLISPPPHHDIYSIEDLAQLIHDLKQANPNAHVCVKLVAESGCGTVAAGVAKAYADIVQISGCEGGTGAAGISSIKNAGSYWEMGIAETQRSLMENGLRDRIRLRVDGGLRTGQDVVIAALLGAEEFGFGTATMVAAGCVMARQCHSNTCPTGIATQDEKLRARFRGTVQSISAYFLAVAQEVREILADMGFRSLADIIGRNDLLTRLSPFADSGAARINTHPLSEPYPEDRPRMCRCVRNDNPAPSMNDRLVEELLPFIESAEPVEREYEIRNIHRSIPVKLNYYIAHKYRDEGLPPDTIRLIFRGTAGQSFGAFNHKGLSLTLIGDANDYAGKGMFGGKVAIIPSDIGGPHRHVIVGNTVLYGAIGGEFYAAGMAGERFAVRNSGAIAVIEGTGHHLCEYMTRGAVVVLGEVGFNVGAGMTGGVIYILDRNDGLKHRINTAYVKLTGLNQDDIGALKSMIRSHQGVTQSRQAGEILSSFDAVLPQFKKVAPV
ncbi:MAG: glutamate synthase large subunit [bacterium]